jgi:riboflavin synthase
VRKYPHLEELHLDRNKHITDKGLIYLLPLKSLEFLNVDNTSVTANGIKQLAPVKIKRITVPKSFSKSEAALLQKEMKDTVIQMSSPGPPEVYKLFAPLH